MDTTGTAQGSKRSAQASPAGARPSRGLAGELLGLAGSLGRHIQALGALAGEESREAAALYVRLAILLAAALFFAAFGYVILLIFFAFLIASVFDVAWIWILLGLALLHLLVTCLCANHIRTHWRTPLFIATRGEIARDLESLNSRSRP